MQTTYPSKGFKNSPFLPTNRTLLPTATGYSHLVGLALRARRSADWPGGRAALRNGFADGWTARRAFPTSWMRPFTGRARPPRERGVTLNGGSRPGAPLGGSALRTGGRVNHFVIFLRKIICAALRGEPSLPSSSIRTTDRNGLATGYSHQIYELRLALFFINKPADVPHRSRDQIILIPEHTVFVQRDFREWCYIGG